MNSRTFNFDVLTKSLGIIKASNYSIYLYVVLS